MATKPTDRNAWQDRTVPPERRVDRLIVEPGEVELRLGASSDDVRLTAAVTLTGPTRVLDTSRRRHCSVVTA